MFLDADHVDSCGTRFGPRPVPFRPARWKIAMAPASERGEARRNRADRLPSRRTCPPVAKRCGGRSFLRNAIAGTPLSLGPQQVAPMKPLAPVMPILWAVMTEGSLSRTSGRARAWYILYRTIVLACTSPRRTAQPVYGACLGCGIWPCWRNRSHSRFGCFLNNKPRRIPGAVNESPIRGRFIDEPDPHFQFPGIYRFESRNCSRE